jgi:hypothetical protein
MSHSLYNIALWLSGLECYTKNFGGSHPAHIKLVTGISLPLEQVVSQLKQFSQTLSFETLAFVLAYPNHFDKHPKKLEISKATKSQTLEALDNLRNRLSQLFGGVKVLFTTSTKFQNIR